MEQLLHLKRANMHLQKEGKWKAPIIEIPEHNSGIDGESFDCYVALTKPKDDKPHKPRRTEIHARGCQGPSKTLEATPPTDAGPTPGETVVPTPPVQVPDAPSIQQAKG